MLAADEPAMTDQTSDTTETETETTETESSESSESEGDDDDESEGDDDDDEPKKDKPKKLKVSFEDTMPRNEAVSYFEAIIGGLRSGRLEFKQDGETLVLNPPDRLEIEVKAVLKGDKGKVVFEIEWSDEHRNLEILN
jgi:amphi-Trp domain-containing protein